MRNENSRTSVELIQSLERIQELLEASISLARAGGLKASAASKGAHQSKAKKARNDIDLSKPIRPFVKQYGIGMSGPKKFTLVLAYLAGGDPSKNVSLEEIKKHWNKMTAKGLLGMKFNRFYSANAKDNDWVNTEKTGLYHLRPSWKKIFDEEH